MPRIIKTLSEGPKSIIEVAVTAYSEEVAKKRGRVYIISRFPLKVSSIENVEAMEFGERAIGLLTDYRVIITLKSGDVFE